MSGSDVCTESAPASLASDLPRQTVVAEVVALLRDELAVNAPEALDADGVSRLLTIGRSTWLDWASRAWTPAPLSLPGRVSRWDKREVLGWMRAGCPARSRWNQIREAMMRRST
jgi:predicted DNA-binding transcriptional regulator AlpA